MFARLTMLARVGAAPKVIEGSSGTSFVTFSMVTNRWMGAGKEPVAEWYNFKAFQKNAEKLQTVPKGASLLVEATPTIEKWNDKEGNARERVVFLVDRVLNVGGSSSSEGSASESARPTVKSKAAPEEDLKDPFDEDPFGDS